MVGYDSASKQRWLDYHNQHESTAFIGLFHATSSVLPSVESYPNYRKPTQSTGVPLLSAAESIQNQTRTKNEHSKSRA